MDLRETLHEAVTNPHSPMSEQIRGFTAGRLKQQLANKPELWDKLTPNYAPGCKRNILTDDYYPALARENVDLETRRISRMTSTGIEVEGGVSEKYDLVIFATGFKAVDFMYPIQVYGSKGRSLSEIWKDGASAYRGVTVEDLPNFGLFYGPNTNLGEYPVVYSLPLEC